MRLELEYQVQEVNDQDNDACSSADPKYPVVGSGLAAKRRMEGSWQEQAGNAQGEQTGAHLGNGAVVYLLPEPKTAEEEAHPQD